MSIDPEQLHRIEGKLDELLQHIRERQIDPNTVFIPKKPKAPRLCPVCEEPISWVPEVSRDQTGKITVNASKRACGCLKTTTPLF
jgi:hypothetical protein